MSSCSYLHFLSKHPKTPYTVRIPAQSFSATAHGLTVFRESETMATAVSTPMITPTLLRELFLDEPGAGIPQAGLCEGAGGKPAVPS
jgi:hypothetical protein